MGIIDEAHAEPIEVRLIALGQNLDAVITAKGGYAQARVQHRP